MLYYLGYDPRIPEYTRGTVKNYGLCRDQWPENGNWPPQIYVREGLRMVGEKVTTEKDILSTACLNDSIAVGSWVIDIHVVQRVSVLSADGKTHVADNEGQIVYPGWNGRKPYDISYIILLPKKSEVTNLLVPVCLSATHVAYGSLRVEPTFVQIGQAAGVAAAVALDHGVAVHEVPVAEVQKNLVNQGVHIHISGCGKF